MRKLLLFTVLVLFSVSCDNGSAYGRFLCRKLSESGLDLSGYSSVVVIPGSGCPGCISEAENYCQTSIMTGNKDVLFIFTDIYSIKTLKNKFKNVDLSRENSVLIDINNTYYDESCSGCIYPQRVFVEDGVPIKAKEL